jgi:hypothetical protein
MRVRQSAGKYRSTWSGSSAKSAEFRERHGNGPVPGQRAVRRSTARRASTRRATARSRRGDTKAAITDYLKKQPGSTAGDLAKGVNLQRNSVSTRLTQMAKAGEIKKATRGYEAQ